MNSPSVLDLVFTTGVQAHIPWTHTRKPKVYPPGRTCSLCPTMLSVFNPGEFCSIHEEPRRYKHPIRKHAA